MKNTTKIYSFEFTKEEIAALQKATLHAGICRKEDKKIYDNLYELFCLNKFEY